MPPPEMKLSAQEEKSMLDKADNWISTVSGLVEEGTGAIENPVQYTKSFFGSRFAKKIEEVTSQAVEKSLYLYLVDEYTGKPMYDASGVYPVKIDVASDLVGKYMPMMRIGLQAASVANGAVALVNVFCPFVPSRLVPTSFMSKAKDFVDDLDKPSNVGEFGSVQKEVDKGDGKAWERAAGL